MGQIVKFEKGCRRCEHLVQLDKNTWICEERVHIDDSSIMPILNGKHTADWNACEGEDYKMIVRKLRTRSC